MRNTSMYKIRLPLRCVKMYIEFDVRKSQQRNEPFNRSLHSLSFSKFEFQICFSNECKQYQKLKKIIQQHFRVKKKNELK